MKVKVKEKAGNKTEREITDFNIHVKARAIKVVYREELIDADEECQNCKDGVIKIMTELFDKIISKTKDLDELEDLILNTYVKAEDPMEKARADHKPLLPKAADNGMM